MPVSKILSFFTRVMLERAALRAAIAGLGALAFSSPRQLGLWFAGLAIFFFLFALDEVGLDWPKPPQPSSEIEVIDFGNGSFQLSVGAGLPHKEASK